MIDLTTIAGVVALAVLVTGILVSWLKITDSNIKKLIAAGLAAVIAVVSKLTGIGFADLDWQGLIVGIFGSVFATKVAYDSVVKPIASRFTKKTS